MNEANIDIDAKIIHFFASLKPWQIWCLDPRKQVYWHYLQKSLWSDAKPQKPRNIKEFFKAIKYAVRYWRTKNSRQS